MKFKNLFMAILAGAALLTACQQEENLGTPKISVEPTVLSFGADEDSSPVQFTATRDWLIASIPDWVALSVDSGKASSEMHTITLSVDQNTEYNRSGDVIFTIGLAKAVLTVNQEGPLGEVKTGSGTLEDPFTVAGVVAYVNELGGDVQSPEKVFVKGKISAITEEYSAQYGNGTFYMTDDGSAGGDTFYAYRILYLGNAKWKSGDTQIAVGDDVVVYGYVVNYKGNTPETVQNGAFLYSLNGEEKGGASGGTGEASGSGTLEDPFNVAAAIKAVEGLTWTSTTEYDKVGPYYVKGVVKSITEEYGTQYGNGTFYIEDEGVGNEFYVYRALYLGNKKFSSGDTQIAVGDEVIIYAELMNYRGNTPETVLNSGYLYSLNGSTGGDDPTPGGETSEPSGTGTLDDPFNAAAAIAKAEETGETATADKYYIKGTVVGTPDINTQYGNATFYISDDGGTTKFYIYRIYSFGGEKFTDANAIKEGDVVVVYANIVNYRGNTPETAQGGELISVNDSGDTPGGETGEVKAVTIAEFNAAEESQTQVYELVGTIGGTINTTYGNFDLTDESGTVYVYGLTATELGYGAKNDKSYASLGLAEGDKIKIRGYRGSYNGKIEVMNAWFIEKVGEGGGDTPGGETGEVKAVTIADFNAASESQTQVYELVGTIGGTINTTYGNFDLTDESGTVYVYGLTATELGYGASNDKSYSSLGLAEGDKIKIRGYRGSYNGKIEVVYAWFIEKVGEGGGDTPGGDEPGGNDGIEGTTDADGITTVTLGKDYLAANQNASVNSVVSYTNDSSYTGSVTELRIYKGQNLKVTVADGYTITEIDITAGANNGTNRGNHAENVVTVADGASATLTAETDVKTSSITVTGNTTFVNLNAKMYQIRIEELTIKYKAVE